ncbi:Hypp7942 [Branchiostoma lanceolatum]|uniref:Hypp7942 protein n=1 Tax=Branchiostoma lanceolatum TaxID=7740 RepID=A0A8J9Z575_BRALA|nr:Hypp7942 [Branchiostoma lanceolatum]
MDRSYDQGVMAAASSSEKNVMSKLAGLSQSVGSAQRKGKMAGGMVPGKIMSQVQALATPDSIATLDKMGLLTKLGPLAAVLIGMSGMGKGGKKGGKKSGGLFKGLGSKSKGNKIDLGALQSLGSMLGGGGGGGMAGMAGMAAGMMGPKMPGLGGGGGRGGFNPRDGLDMQDARALAGMATRSDNPGLERQRAPQGHRFDPSDGLDMEDARGMYDMYRGQSDGRSGGIEVSPTRGP